jgi:HD-GYP domain-containing protein (c-di-GMP phosphodiesterase class II)
MNRENLFYKVPVDLFYSGGQYDFNLYTKKDSHFDIILQKGDFYPQNLSSFTNKEKNFESSFFVKNEEKLIYFKHSEEYLKQITFDEKIPLDIKAKIAYESVSGIVENLLQQPESKEIVGRIKSLLDTSLQMILSHEASIKSLIKVSSHDYYTYTHSVDVAIYAIGFANYQGYSYEAIRNLGYAALMHDIGKSKVPSAIINKKGKLTDEEFKEMKKHPRYGYDLLLSHGEENRDVLEGVLQHHEKKHGNGYPRNLTHHEINDFAKIIQIADIFSALTAKRSYKDAYSSFKALQLMKQFMVQDVDASLLNDFIRFMGRTSQLKEAA